MKKLSEKLSIWVVKHFLISLQANFCSAANHATVFCGRFICMEKDYRRMYCIHAAFFINYWELLNIITLINHCDSYKDWRASMKSQLKNLWYDEEMFRNWKRELGKLWRVLYSDSLWFSLIFFSFSFHPGTDRTFLSLEKFFLSFGKAFLNSTRKGWVRQFSGVVWKPWTYKHSASTFFSLNQS